MFEGELKENSDLLLYQDCEELRNQFFSLEVPRNVAEILGVSYERLVYHLYKASEDSKYKKFEVLKKSGSSRMISAPSPGLKIIQRKLSQVLYSVYSPKPSVHGFLPNKSILTNASQYSGKRFVLNIDLKDFFPSIHFGRVRGVFIAPPYKRSKEVATVLAQICCHANQLPQGAPTSPIVSNMISARMDSQLQRLAKEYKCTYTRYADDITFSTTLPKFPAELAYVTSEGDGSKILLGEKLISAIKDNDFQVNESKIRLQHKSNHQEVTGLTVNEFPNVDREYVRQISAMLHAWQSFGLKAVEQRYCEKYRKKPTEIKKDIPSFKTVLRGRINFLGMIRGKNDLIYQKRLDWYRSLSKRDCQITNLSDSSP